MRSNALSRLHRQIFGGLAIVATLSGLVSGQTRTSTRVLEANDLHMAGSKADWVSVGILPNGYVRIRNANLRKLIAVAMAFPIARSPRVHPGSIPINSTS